MTVSDAMDAVMRHYRTTTGCGREHAALLAELEAEIRADECARLTLIVKRIRSPSPSPPEAP